MLKSTYKFHYFGISDKGLVREKNEDAWGANPDMGVFVIADGMGGHNAGDIAAWEAVNFFISNFLKVNHEKEDFLGEVVKKTNRFVFEKSKENSAYSGMGTTFVTLYFDEDKAQFAHVGDSRIYLFRNQKLMRLTEDHSLINELIHLGIIKEEEDSFSSFKNTLTKALGTSLEVEPSLGSIEILKDDLFLLATDGLTNALKDGEIEKVLCEEPVLEKLGSQLVEKANLKGGKDNISALLVKIK